MDAFMETMLRNGMRRADAQMVHDVASHAVSEAVKTVTRICETVPEDHLKLVALVIACGFLDDRLRGIEAESRKIMGEVMSAIKSQS